MTTTEATPGQAYRAALIERWSARGRCVDGRSWDQLPKEDRDDLEAAADAALIVAIPVVAMRLAEAAEENTRLMLTFDSHVRETGKIVGERDEGRRELSACKQNNAAIAVQLDQYRDERDEAREQRDRLRQLATQVLAAYESGTVVSGELAGIWRETLEANGG
jgi:hypothetical protein